MTVLALPVGWSVEAQAPNAVDRTLFVRVSPSHSLPDGVPSVGARAAADLPREGPIHLVVFLHGWGGCVRVLLSSEPVACRTGGRPRAGWGLADRFDDARTGQLLVVPQLSLRPRDGAPGRFAEAGYARGLIEELLGDALTPLVGSPRTWDDVASLTLVAHSAGFETALALLRQPDIASRTRNVVLLDALYAGVLPFARWLEAAPGERHLVSLYTGGKTARQSRTLASRLRRSLGERVATVTDGSGAAAIADHAAVIWRTATPHGQVPRAHLREVLAALSQRR